VITSLMPYAIWLLALSAATAITTRSGYALQLPSKAATMAEPQSIDEILSIQDDTKFAIALSTLVGDREEAVGYEHLSTAERVIYCVDGLEREVNNGGFLQFFDNAAGDHAMDTIESLRILGAPKTVALVVKAVGVFPHGRPAADRARRQQQTEQLGEEVETMFEQLDAAFNKYPEDLTGLERKYVGDHQVQFHRP
jgi:uncharacterized protein DUF4375